LEVEIEKDKEGGFVSEMGRNEGSGGKARRGMKEGRKEGRSCSDRSPAAFFISD
jgi:hypothetical protein